MNIVLHGAYQGENFGDELLLLILAKWVTEHNENEIILPYAREFYHEQINSKDYYGRKGLRQGDLLIYGGGGYFGEPNHNQLKWGFSFFKKHVFPAEYFHYFNKKYLIVGVGAGPVTNIFTRKAIIRIVNNSQKTLVRDQESLDYLIKYGADKDKLSVTGDLVLSMSIKDIPSSIVTDVKSSLIYNNVEESTLGIHIAMFKNDSNYPEEISRVLEGIIKYLNKNPKVKPVLIADKRNSSPQNDTIEYLSTHIKTECIVYKHENAERTCAVLSQLDAVITTKLHVGITAFALGVKPLSFAAHQKTERFYKQIGKNNNVVNLNEVNEIDIYKKISAFYQDDFWDGQTREIKDKLKKEALENKNEVQRIIRNNINMNEN